MRVLKHACICSVCVVIIAACLLSRSDEAKQTNSNLAANRSLTLPNSNSNQFDVAEFERNRELWTSKNIQHYKMIVGASGQMANFPEEVLIEVRDGQSQSIKSLSKTGKNAVHTYTEFDTVEDLFTFVRRQRAIGAKSLWVSYDTDFGYPARIEADQDGYRGNDDELTLTVKSFDVIGARMGKL